VEGDQAFQDVVAIAPDDAWAVGWSLQGGVFYLPFVEHWDGADWRLVPIPGKNQNTTFTDVDASGPDDVWAVGFASGRHPYEAVVYHWDGTSWTRLNRPPFRAERDASLDGVSAVAPDDVWVVGSVPLSGQPLTAHWDGTSWTE